MFRELYSEKRVVAEERRSRLDNSPMGRFQEAFLASAISNNYRRPIIGYELDVAGLGRRGPAPGSLALGLGVADGAMDAAQAHELAALDELFQAEQWGEDHEAGKRRHHVAEAIAIATRFIRLSSAPPG